MKPRWRRVAPTELDTWRRRLADHPCEVGGEVRHMFALSCLDGFGVDVLRVVTDGGRWALGVVHPGRVLVPCGDPDLIAAAGTPSRRWRLLVGDAPAAEAVMGGGVPTGTRVHHQRYMTVDHEAIPSARELPDPGLRRAVPEDLDRLASLAVRLHVDDEFGPDPGRQAYRGYRDRLVQTVDRGLVWVVGPVGAPFLKLERSVSSPVWGVQLSGIVLVPDQRGQGLGRAAVAAAVRGALAEGPGDRPVSLHVRHANTAARTAYAAAGFVDREEWRLAVRT